MLKINFRKFFCKFVKGWLYECLDCKRYEVIEYTTVKECDLCGRIAVAGCIATGHAIEVTYVKGDEPTMKCVPSMCCAKPPPPPPPPKYPKVCPLMGIQGAGWFNSYKLFGDEIKPEKYLSELRMTGASIHDSFAWLSSGNPKHRNLKYLVPFKWIESEKKFDLGGRNEQFFDQLRQAIIMHRDVDMDFMVQLWMRLDYTNAVYKNNVNSVTNFWQPEAMSYHRQYVNWIIQTYEEADVYNPYIKIMNEPSHSSGEQFHRLMYFHEMLWQEVLFEYTDISRIVCDLTGSEGTAGELREPHNCPKPADCDRGGRHGKAWYSRYRGNAAVGEKHKRATWADHDGRTLRAMRGNYKRRFTDDGGGEMGDGRYVVRGIKLADGGQAEFLGAKLAGIQKETGHYPVQCFFTHEVLEYDEDKNLFIPISTYERVKPTFERAKRFCEGYWNVIGG